MQNSSMVVKPNYNYNQLFYSAGRSFSNFWVYHIRVKNPITKIDVYQKLMVKF